MSASHDDKLLLIDGLNIARRVWEAIPIDDSPEKAVGATRSCIASFKRALDEHAPTHVLAAFDHGGPTWRRALYPEYHAGRKEMPASLKDALPSLFAQLRALSVYCVSIPNVEADDVIAAAYYRWAQRSRGPAVVLSTDKDLVALVADGAQVRDHFKNEWRDENWVQLKFGVPASKLHSLLALTGDASDGVPGVPGVGPKTAAKWLNAHGSLLDVLREAHSNPSAGVITGKAADALRAHLEEVQLAFQLVSFKTDIQLGVSWNQLRYVPAEEEPVSGPSI